MQSYLSDRQHCVAMGGCRSTFVTNLTDVPQGSVLGPFLFFIFTTPVGNIIDSFGVTYHQYADDTQLYTTIKLSSSDKLASMSACADAVTSWHLENDVLLNQNKTEAIITGIRQQIAKFDRSAGVAVAGTNVPFVDKLRVLGVTLDSQLTFEDHISGVVSTCNYHMRALRHIRPLITKEMANVAACSILCSRLNYCNSVLYGMIGITAHNIGRLQRVQNSLARVVCHAPYRSSATLLRQSLHWLPIEARITFKILMLTYKVRNHRQPTYLSSMITDYKPARFLRSAVSDLLVIPRTNTVTASRAFRIAAATVRSCDSINGFRRQLKTHLFDLAYKSP